MDMKRIIFTLVMGVCCLLLPQRMKAQEAGQQSNAQEASKQKYAATIEMKKGYLSGICILAKEEDIYRACLFNEFGISALDFTYEPARRKVKLQHVIKMLDKWYIRKVLKKDLANVVDNLLKGVTTYTDEKYHINYQFTRLNENADSTDSTDSTDSADSTDSTELRQDDATKE